MHISLYQVGLIAFAVFCTAVFIQLCYYLILFRRLAVYKPSKDGGTTSEPVSVIICAKDEAENLMNNLPGILVQEYPQKHEIIVVNDNSGDHSKYIIEEFKQAFNPNLLHLELKQDAKMIIGKKYPLSMGIISAKFETLILTDADCVPASEHWVSKIQEAFRPGIEVVLGYGAYHKKPGLLNKLIRFETFHSALQYLSYALAGIPYMGVGRNLSYKRSLFMKSKGFSSINMIPSGDDDLFINKVATKTNTAIVIDPESHTLSEAKTSWKDWMRQKYRHYTTTKYYQPKHKLWLGLYSFSFGLIYPLLFVAMVGFNWWIPLAVISIRWVVQGFVFYKSMKKLNELDLFPLFILFDIWMVLYYILTLPSLWRGPKQKWK